MIKYEMVSRKPRPVYNVAFADKIGQVFKNLDKPVSIAKRWCLVDLTEFRGQNDPEGVEVPILYFKSRRAAFHFFETGEKFKTNPVFAVMGGRKGTKRIR
jgi:hypothetical protein